MKMTQAHALPEGLGRQVTPRYFASIREALGKPREVRTTLARTVLELRAELIELGGSYAQALALGRALRSAIDQTMCDDHATIQDGCEVAFFPPVTGG